VYVFNILFVFCNSLDIFILMLLAFVTLGLVSSVFAKRLSGKVIGNFGDVLPSQSLSVAVKMSAK